MSINGLLARFGVAYALVLLAAAALFSFLGIKHGSGVSVAAIVGAAYYATGAFTKANDRWFTDSEKRGVFWGMVGISMAIELILAWIVMLASGVTIPLTWTLGVIAFIGALHALVIYFVLRGSKKAFQKQQEAAASKRLAGSASQ